MSRNVYRILTIFLAGLCASCSPQWSSPIASDGVTSPNWVAGLWVDKSSDRILRLTARDKDFEVLYTDSKFVFLGSGLITQHNGDNFLNVMLKGGRYLSNDKDRYPGKAPLSGFLVSYIDKVGDDEIRITQINYEKLASSWGSNDDVIGINLCRGKTLHGWDIKPSDFALQRPDLICNLLDTKALSSKGIFQKLERSDTSVELYRVGHVQTP